jgi:hypothetical protein
MKKIVFAGLILLSSFLLLKYFEFPVKNYNCDKEFKNCFVTGKYKNMNDCESVNVRQGWYCNSLDKNNITCQEKESAIVESYCSK